MLKIIASKIIVLKMLLKAACKTNAHFGLRCAFVCFFKFTKTIILNRSKQVFQIETHVTEHCNLNCAGCLHFSSLADEINLDPASFEHDCARLAKISPKLSTLKLLGGEPLLHPKLSVFFEIARRYFKTTIIQLTTNGTLLSRQPDGFWDACRKYKIYIEISDYPLNIDVKTIRKKCGKYRACVGYSTPRENEMYKMVLDLDGAQDPETNFASCMWGKYTDCVTLRDGKIYTCPMAAHIQFFNKYFNKDLKITEADYVDIHSVTDKKSIFEFLGKPFPFCRYCKPSAMAGGVKWAISKKDISEWT
jgi:MoaA/NifB/PqqE/SkfB family radical SAM enzyme